MHRIRLGSLAIAAAAYAAGCAGVEEPQTLSGPSAAGSSAEVSATTAPAPAPASANPATEPSPPVTPAADVSAPTLAGHWYLDREGQRNVLMLATDATGNLGGTMSVDSPGAIPAAIDHVTYRVTFDGTGELRFRAQGPDGSTWIQLRVTDGVARGRFATPRVGIAGEQPPAEATGYDGRLTGWRAETFDAALVPRTFALTIDGQAATLRLDQAANGVGFVGQLRIFGNAAGELAEQPAEDVSIEAWNGQTLAFSRPAAATVPRFSGTVAGRNVSGTWRDAAGYGGVWSGTRAEILGHGLAVHPADQVRRWQASTRRRLRALVMDGSSRPSAVQVTELSTGGAPFPQGALLANRDDAEALWPQAYTVSELAFEATLPNRYGTAPLTRKLHGMMSVPTTAAPPGGYPVVVAINGHSGSAKRLFNPNDTMYWYGEAFARRGNVVIAVDVGHRPVADRNGYYVSYEDGDDPEGGNAPHPSIHAEGMTTDWEEDGERTWDVMRALDHVLQRPDVDPTRVSVVGLSMGAEVADWMGALDSRVSVTIPAGDPPDWFQMYLAGNHPCWRWQAGDEREYLGTSDLYALVAGRTLIRETGEKDYTYSIANPTFATAKQEVRDAHPAFDALGGKLLHYVHWDQHAFHFGDALPDAEADGVTAMVDEGPTAAAPWLIDWQNDATMAVTAPTILDLLPPAGAVAARTGLPSHARRP